jgi:hypothetical protein
VQQEKKAGLVIMDAFNSKNMERSEEREMMKKKRIMLMVFKDRT